MFLRMVKRVLLFVGISLLAFPVFAKTKYQPQLIHLDRDGEKWAEKTLRKLSPEEKVGQLFMIWVRAQFLNVDSADYVQLRDDIRKYNIVSFCMTVRYDPPFLYMSEPYQAAALLH